MSISQILRWISDSGGPDSECMSRRCTGDGHDLSFDACTLRRRTNESVDMCFDTGSYVSTRIAWSIGINYCNLQIDPPLDPVE